MRPRPTAKAKIPINPPKSVGSGPFILDKFKKDVIGEFRRFDYYFKKDADGVQRRHGCRLLAGGTMTQYVVERVLLFIPTIIFASVLIFLLMRLIPGDPALLHLLGDTGATEWTQDGLDRERARLGTDKWLPIQYFVWEGGMLKGDFGESMFYDTPVSEDLKDRLPVTVQLTIMGLALAIAISVP